MSCDLQMSCGGSNLTKRPDDFWLPQLRKPDAEVGHPFQTARRHHPGGDWTYARSLSFMPLSRLAGCLLVPKLHRVYTCRDTHREKSGIFREVIMVRMGCRVGAAGWLALVCALALSADDKKTADGFTPLFNGKDLSGWKVPEGDNGHWKVVDGVIDYDARSEGKGDKCLWTTQSFGDFVLRCDWRLKNDEPGFKHGVPVILPDGSHKKGPDGKEVKVEIDDVDSGIYLRGSSASQVNIWMWPIGSGEVYGYRMNQRMPPEVRAGVTPKKKADRPRGEWNTFEITMKGDRLWVKLNGEEVISNAQLPGVPKTGPIALQHHGAYDAKTKQWKAPPSLVQFRNIAIKELK
jgi:hypothetical protein